MSIVCLTYVTMVKRVHWERSRASTRNERKGIGTNTKVDEDVQSSRSSQNLSDGSCKMEMVLQITSK